MYSVRPVQPELARHGRTKSTHILGVEAPGAGSGRGGQTEKIRSRSRQNSSQSALHGEVVAI